MGYKKLSNLVAQLLALIKQDEFKQLTKLDKEKLLKDIELNLL